MSWGYKIAFAYGSFVIMILFFLFIASRQSNELIEDHYYEKELQFQNVLNANVNLSSSHEKPIIIIENQQLNIELPAKLSTNVSDGKIEFIRMADKSKDLSTEFTIDATRRFQIPIEKFQAGIYKLRIQWKDRGIPYMFEDQFNYPKP